MNHKGKPEPKRYFFDTEFNDTLQGFDIDFISIGIVSEDGKHEYYGISNAFNLEAASSDPWLHENVVLKLLPQDEWQSIEDIRQGILDMIEPCENVEFWAKNGSYDNVMLCRIFGGMNALRTTLQQEKGIKKITFRDTNELLRIVPKHGVPDMPEKLEHISIDDARQERKVFNVCKTAIQSDQVRKLNIF